MREHRPSTPAVRTSKDQQTAQHLLHFSCEGRTPFWRELSIYRFADSRVHVFRPSFFSFLPAALVLPRASLSDEKTPLPYCYICGPAATSLRVMEINVLDERAKKVTSMKTHELSTIEIRCEIRATRSKTARTAMAFLVFFFFFLASLAPFLVPSTFFSKWKINHLNIGKPPRKLRKSQNSTRLHRRQVVAPMEAPHDSRDQRGLVGVVVGHLRFVRVRQVHRQPAVGVDA